MPSGNSCSNSINVISSVARNPCVNTRDSSASNNLSSANPLVENVSAITNTSRRSNASSLKSLSYACSSA